MKNINYIFILVITCLYISCQNKTSEKSGFNGEYISIHDPITIPIEELLEDYDTIRLEVTNESLIRRIEQLLIMNDKLYIRDGNLIFIFTKEGKFISKIDHVGKGPEEYIGIYNLSLDYVHHKIILTDNFGSKILIYDAEGKFEKIIKLKFNPHYIIPFNNGYIQFGGGNSRSFAGFDQNMDKYNIHFLDSIGNVLSYTISDETPRTIEIGSNWCYISLENGNILFQPLLSDTIYEIDKDRIANPLYVFDNQSKYMLMTNAQKRKFSFRYTLKTNTIKEKEQQGYLLAWGFILNTKDWLYCNFTNWDNPIQLYYSKPEKQSITLDQHKLGGNNMLKILFIENPPIATYHDYFYVSPSFSKNFEEDEFDKLSDGKLKTYLKSTNWFNANPLLIKYKINFPKRSE